MSVPEFSTTPIRPFSSGLLGRAERVAMFLDIAESVRLIEADQDSVVSRWVDLIDAIGEQVEKTPDGRIVKHTGDGLLLEFEHARSAAALAFAVIRLNEERNQGVAEERRIRLRFGAALGEVIQGQGDIYGHDVNVAARLMSLAEPGELVVTAAVRDHLTADLDADVEDIGECYLRHVTEPVRTFRVRPPGPRGPMLVPRAGNERLLPAIAVLPLDARSGQATDRMVGEALADELIHTLSRSGTLDVISRLSSRALAGRAMPPDEISECLGTDYVLSGFFITHSARFELSLELCEARSGRIIWAMPFHLTHAEIAEDRAPYIDEVVKGVVGAITREEVKQVRRRPLPTLHAHTLLTAAVNLMARLGRRDFERAREVLDALLERSPREPLALARKAVWWVMKAQQGWSDDLQRDAYLAADAAARALDEDPDCSVALMADGSVQAHFFKRLDLAEARYDEAIEIDHSNALAWLRRGALCAFSDRGDRAIEDTLRAQRLSPIDPSKFLIDSLTASAYLTAGNDESALTYAERSLRLNRLHTSTLRVMAVAQWRLGREHDARATVAELTRLEPGLTVSGYLARMPSARFQIGRTVANILHEAGVPG